MKLDLSELPDRRVANKPDNPQPCRHTMLSHNGNGYIICAYCSALFSVADVFNCIILALENGK